MGKKLIRRRFEFTLILRLLREELRLVLRDELLDFDDELRLTERWLREGAER